LVYKKIFKDEKYIPRKVPKKERLKIIEENLQRYSIEDFYKRFNE